MKKFLATAEILLMLNGQVEAAAVAGSDDWEDLTEQEELSSTTPLEVHGKVKLERKIFSGPADYPTTFVETKNIASAQIDWRLRFAPSWYIKGRLQGDRIYYGRGGRPQYAQYGGRLDFAKLYALQSRRQRFFESGTEKNNTVFTAGLDYKINRHWTIGGISHALNELRIKN